MSSQLLFRQQIGRCLRPKTDGSAAIVCDHAGNVHRHGLPDAAHEWSLDSKKRPGRVPDGGTGIRRCGACTEVFAKTANRDSCPMPDAAGCLFRPVMPLVREGVLEEVLSPPWARGLDIRRAHGWQWYELLRRADGDLARLRQIQVARNYKAGWVHYVMRESAEKRGAA
jgi:hypothetical protein